MEGEEEKIRNITGNNKYIIFNKNTSDYKKVSKKLKKIAKNVKELCNKFPIY